MEDNIAADLLKATYKKTTGLELKEFVFTGVTDTRFYGRYFDIPSLCFGPIARDIHAFDERVDIESLRRVTRTIAGFVAEWCGSEHANHNE